METIKRYFLKDNEIPVISYQFFINGVEIVKTETDNLIEISEEKYNEITERRDKEFKENKLKKIASEAEDLNNKRKKREEILKRLGLSEDEISLF